MATTNTSSKETAISMAIVFVVAGVWATYGLTGAPGWLLVVGILLSMFSGWWWAFGRRAVFSGSSQGMDRQRNRSRRS